MTNHTARLPTLPSLLAFVLLLLLANVGDARDDPNDPWVAKVGDLTLTRSRLAGAVAARVRSELLDLGSGPLTVLRQMVEERAVNQEARRLGVQIAAADVEAAWKKLDRKVRHQTGGHKTLEDVIREEGSTVGELRDNLRNQLLKERIAAHESNLGRTLPKEENQRIAQTEVVITEVLKRTKAEYGWRTAIQEAPTPMEASLVAKVRVYPTALPRPGDPVVPGEPISVREFGEELIDRLPRADIKDIILQECKAALTRQVALSKEEMTRVIEEEKARWNKTRELATQEALQSVSYENYVKARFKVDLEYMKNDRYFRGLFGLVRRFRGEVTPEEIRKQYDDNREALYGEAIVVTDVEVLFAPQSPLLGDRGGRDRKQALKLANQLLARYHGGVPFEQITRDLNARRDATFKAQRLKVRNTAQGRLLYDRASKMKDGDVSRPFETLSEVHVIRREKLVPAPTFDQVSSIIREGMARQRSHGWLEERLEDEASVQIRWPLPSAR